MKKFHFNLETLLKTRTLESKRLQAELKVIKEQYLVLEKNSAEIEKKISLTHQEHHDKRMQGDMRYEKEYALYLDLLKKNLKIAQKNRQEKQKELLNMQNQALKAFKKRKIVEKLKEKKYSLWQENFKKSL